MKKTLMIAGASIIALSTAVSASTFTIGGGAIGAIPGGATNEVLTNVFGIGSVVGFFGATVSLDSASDVYVDFIGYEAAFDNSFTMNAPVAQTVTYSTGVPNTAYAGPGGTPPLASYTFTSVGSGALDFSFASAQAGSVANGSNPLNLAGGPVNFFAAFGGSTDTVYLFFDDTGDGDDDNHDDFVVRLSTNKNPGTPNHVPLPAAGFLLIGALGGLGLAKRRKKA